jgi:hypothetical protein
LYALSDKYLFLWMIAATAAEKAAAVKAEAEAKLVATLNAADGPEKTANVIAPAAQSEQVVDGNKISRLPS